MRQVSQQFGISDESLRRLAMRDGVELSTLTPTERKLTPAQQEAARELVQSGVSLRQTARQFGISRCALEGLLKEERDTLQLQKPKLTAEQVEQARTLLDVGVSLRQAAKSLGTTSYTLARYLKKGKVMKCMRMNKKVEHWLILPTLHFLCLAAEPTGNEPQVVPCTDPS